jgi:hypothetical protein
LDAPRKPVILHPHTSYFIPIELCSSGTWLFRGEKLNYFESIIKVLFPVFGFNMDIKDESFKES